MMFELYMKVRYVGPDSFSADIRENDFGYVIEDYKDGNYEIEFSNADGISKAQLVIPERYLINADKDICGNK